MLVIPLAVALVVLHEPRWYPALDLAQTELHVRDVGTDRTPLTGAIGRLGAEGEQASHPGPLSFFALAPVYRLAGSDPWALQVATVVLHLLAVGVCLWISHRRGGTRLLALMAVCLTVLLRLYGASILTEPWIAYLPMLWWVVFVLAVWSVVEDDLALLPVAVAAGSLCAQTHISYVGLIGGLGGWALATVLVRGARRRGAGSTPGHRWAWLTTSTVLGAVLWAPPVLEELRGGRGNLSVLVDYFTSSPEQAIGLRRGSEVIFANLDPWRLLLGHADAKVVTEPASWSAGGVVLLIIWIASIVLAWRLGHRSLLRLDAVLAIALGIAVFSASRIYGLPWAWLTQWVWGLTALLVIAVAWTISCAVQERWRGSRRMLPVQMSAFGVLALIAFASALALVNDAAEVEPDDVDSSSALRHLVPATVEAIHGRTNGDRDERFLITWTDPVGVVGDLQAYGLANELDREGIGIGFAGAARLRAAPHLTMDASEATVVLRLVTGPAISLWEQKAGARRIALFDPRTADERALQERLRSEVDETLREIGMAEVIPQLDLSLVGFLFRTDLSIPEELTAKVVRILALGAPSAVFLETGDTSTELSTAPAG